MCMQLAALVGPRELEDFFQKLGQVREVKMIADKNSRRSKGIAYVEFHDEATVDSALLLSGTKLFGVPIIVQRTMAEKNRWVWSGLGIRSCTLTSCVCLGWLPMPRI